MLLVGLTGGLGAGKSTVARMLAERGAVVVDADDLARRALDPGHPGYDRVVETFGDDILDASGLVDRTKLAEAVFADEGKRRALESIVHPEVFRLLAEEIERRRDRDDIVVFDAPLIIETRFDEACDVVVVVAAPLEHQIERVLRDRGMSEAEARARIAAQISPEQRAARADVVLANDGDLASLERQVGTLWERLGREAAGR
ncbi:MAG TPA: dephospho-CoA kinase [Actinomycetota bacterium]|nr:dephospho-CoA kinase [Actinomycetota bacterium]